MKFKSLRTKLIFLVAFILISGFLTTNILSFQVSKDALRTTILQNELPLTSDNIYSEIQSDLLSPIFVSSLMANDTFLRDWVLEGEADINRVTRYLKQIRDRYDALTTYFISNNTKKYYHYKGVSRTINLEDPEDGWFVRVRDMQEDYEINVDDNIEDGGKITIFVNYRAVDYDGNFIGVTGMGLGIDTVSRLVQEYEQSFGRNIFFVDKDGIVRISSHETIKDADITNIEGINAFAAKILNQDRASFSYQRNGEEFLLTTRYIPELKWFLFVELPESEATAGIRRSFIENLLIGFIVIGVTLGLIIYSINVFQRQLEEMAVTDKLTGLGNRQAFDIAMNQQLSRNRRTKETMSLLLIDIDHFKLVNDTYGHIVGDEVISRSAAFIRQLLREMDVMCRWGGEEFAVLMPSCDIVNAARIAESIRSKVAGTSFVSSAPEQRITISIGISEVKLDDSDDEVLLRADKALYMAKDKGRNRIEGA